MLLRDCIYMCREVGTANQIFIGYVYEYVIQLYSLHLEQTDNTSWHKHDTGFYYSTIHRWQKYNREQLISRTQL